MKTMSLQGFIRGKSVRATISDKVAPYRWTGRTASSACRHRTCSGSATSPVWPLGGASSISPSSSAPIWRIVGWRVSRTRSAHLSPRRLTGRASPNPLHRPTCLWRHDQCCTNIHAGPLIGGWSRLHKPNSKADHLNGGGSGLGRQSEDRAMGSSDDGSLNQNRPSNPSRSTEVS